MVTRFQCVCGRRLKTSDDKVDKKAKCPQCDRWLRIPSSETYDTKAEETGPPARKVKMHPGTRSGGPQGAAEPSTSSRIQPTGSPGPPNKGRVVIADENEDDLKKLSTLLGQHGYDVLETTSGDKAVGLVREADPVAVVLDVHLNELSGFQTVKQIHDPANEANLHVWSVPVMMTTDRVRGRDKQYAISLGVAGYFQKPLIPSKFCHRLEQAVTSYRPQ